MNTIEASRKEITSDLSERLERYINPNMDTRIYWAKEVTFDYTTSHRIRVDYMRFNPLNNYASGIEKGDVYCYEIKSCMADYKSGYGTNFIGDFNYLVMPQELYEQVKNDLHWKYVGVLCPIGNSLEVLKKPRRYSREKSIAEILLAMFRSANRENIKAKLKEEGTNL